MAANAACAAAAGIRHCVTGCLTELCNATGPCCIAASWLHRPGCTLRPAARCLCAGCCWLQDGAPGRVHPQHLVVVLNHVDGDGVLARKILESRGEEGLHKEEARQPEDGGSAVLVPALQPQGFWSGAAPRWTTKALTCVGEAMLENAGLNPHKRLLSAMGYACLGPQHQIEQAGTLRAPANTT